MKILGSSELVRDVQKQDLCVDCGACVGLCPYFASYKGKIAQLFACSLPQGRCHAHCPKTDVDPDVLSRSFFDRPYDGSDLGYYRSVWKTRAGKALAGHGAVQNGGTVTALLVTALDKGMIDGAALTGRKGLIPQPVLAKDREGVLSCSGSKYMASPTLSTVNEAAKSGLGKLAVVGTPCQMTALTRMRMNPTGRDDFFHPVAFQIGLFCTWALDTRRLMGLLSGRIDPENILGMDVLPPPAQVMALKTKDGVMTIPLDDIRQTIPKGCAVCPDMTAEFSDVSVGAFETDVAWNTVIVRTKQGEALMNAAVACGYLERETMPEESPAHLARAANAKKRRALTQAGELNLLNTDPDIGPSALIIDPDIVNAILGEDKP